MPRKSKNATSTHHETSDYVQQLKDQLQQNEKNSTQSYLKNFIGSSTGNETGMLNKFKNNFISTSKNSSGLKIEIAKSSSSTDSSLQKNADDLFESDISDIKKPSKPKSISLTKTPKNIKNPKTKPTVLNSVKPRKIRDEDLKVSMSSDFEEGIHEDVDASPDNLTLKTNITDKLSKLSTKRIRTPAKDDYFDLDDDIQPSPMKEYDDNIKISNKVVKKSTKQIKPVIKQKKPMKKVSNSVKVINSKKPNLINKRKKVNTNIVRQQIENNENKNKIIKDLILEAKASNKRVRFPPSLFEDNVYNYTTTNYKYKQVNGEMQPFLDESNPISVVQLTTNQTNKPKRRTSVSNTNKVNTVNNANRIKPRKLAPFSIYGWYSDIESGSEKKARLAVDDSPQEINYEPIPDGIKAGVCFDLTNFKVVNMKMKPKSKTKLEKAVGAEVYHVLQGQGNPKLKVCIASNKFLAREKVTFVIPEGNEYTIENIGKEETELLVFLDKKVYGNN